MSVNFTFILLLKFLYMEINNNYFHVSIILYNINVEELNIDLKKKKLKQ